MQRPKTKQDAETGADLPNGAVAKAGLNKSIAEAAWPVFFDVLVAKVEEAERQVIKVPPVYTTQTCADCGYRQSMLHAVVGQTVLVRALRCGA
jgi:putative transposase